MSRNNPLFLENNVIFSEMAKTEKGFSNKFQNGTVRFLYYTEKVDQLLLIGDVQNVVKVSRTGHARIVEN